MPRIDDEALKSIVYLYEGTVAARKGDKPGATGFLLMIRYFYRNHVFNHVYVVTNAHVIEDMTKNIGKAKNKRIAVRINTTTGKPYVHLTENNNWVCHTDYDDVAICNIHIAESAKKRLSWQGVSRDMLLSKKMITEYNIGIGTDIYIVGRFNKYAGVLSNKPSVRIGHIALNADENEKVSQRETRGIPHQQESFILNCRSDAGYSGSPVFVELYSSTDGIKKMLIDYFEMVETIQNDLVALVYAAVADKNQPGRFLYQVQSRTGLPEIINAKLAQTYDKLRIRLLGINWGHYPASHILSSGEKFPDNTGFSCTVPAWKLDELLDDPRVLADREIIEERFRKDTDLRLESKGEF